ncbi:MAG: hypothetical protein Q8P41_12985 [Pseudomonadota bacterium]|nr:hypothetical protein [Pseudomonadota bacterium]
MFKHVDRALNSLANSEVRISLLGSIRMGCDALVVLRPVVMGIFALPTFALKAWGPWVVGGSAAAACIGFVGSKASVWRDGMSRRKIDIDHSDDITASLGALHRVLLDRDDPTKMRQLLLGSVASTVNRVCPERGAHVFAGLLLPQGEHLVLARTPGVATQTVSCWRVQQLHTPPCLFVYLRADGAQKHELFI